MLRLVNRLSGRRRAGGLRYGANLLGQAAGRGVYLAAGFAAFVMVGHFAGPAALQWFDALDAEQENLRAALQWALHQPDAAVLYRFAHPLTRYWYARGRWQPCWSGWVGQADSLRVLTARK